MCSAQAVLAVPQGQCVMLDEPPFPRGAVQQLSQRGENQTCKELKNQLNIYEEYYIQKRDGLANIIHPFWILMFN